MEADNADDKVVDAKVAAVVQRSGAKVSYTTVTATEAKDDNGA